MSLGLLHVKPFYWHRHGGSGFWSLLPFDSQGNEKISYSGKPFPEIIQLTIWPYLRFALSFRDVEDLLAGGIMVSYETVRRWVNQFGPMAWMGIDFDPDNQLPDRNIRN